MALPRFDPGGLSMRRRLALLVLVAVALLVPACLKKPSEIAADPAKRKEIIEALVTNQAARAEVIDRLIGPPPDRAAVIERILKDDGTARSLVAKIPDTHHG